MGNTRLQALCDTLLTKSFIFYLAAFILFLVDLQTTSPVTTQIILVHFKLRGMDPSHAFRIVSIFGTFDNIPDLAKTLDRAGFALFSFLGGIRLIKGLILCLKAKPID